MPDPRQKLYNALSNKFDLGSYDEFNSKMNNPESRKKLYSSVSSNFDLGSYDEFESKIGGVKKKDGTKSNSTSTSVSQKQDSVQKNGSSGTQEFEYKPVYDERGREVKIKNAKGELVPYMEKVPKGFASSTEEREVIRQEQKQKASKPIVTSSNLKKYQEATKVSDEEKATLQQEVNDEFDKKGFWNGISDGAKKGFNFLADTFTAIGTFGTETEASKNFKMETDSFAKEKKQAEQELIASKQPVTPEAIAEKAKEIKLKKKVDGLVVDKNNEFLSNLSEEEIKSLNLERVKQYKTLSDKDKYIATQSEILKNNFERDTKDYATAVAIIKKNKEQGIETNQSLIDFAIEKENSLKEKLDEVKTLESEYISNKENIGSAEEEVDFLKRNYDTADKIKTLAKIGFGDIYNSLSNKLPLMVSDLDQAIFEPLRPGSSEGVLSDDERQQLIDNSIDWENAKELAKSGVKRDIDFENLSLNNFGQFFAQEIGTQLPIFAQMAMPGGIVSIGMTSTFDKYGKMEQESNNIAFEFNGKQFNGFEKENGEIVDSLGNTYDPKEVNITSIREADKSTANKFLTSVTFGTAEAVLGAMPTKNIFGRALSSFSTSGERTLFRQSVKEFVKAKGTSVLNDTATEVVSEGATQIIQNIADISSGNKNIGIYDGVDHAAVSAGMLSFFMSASPAVAGLALKPFSESKENKQVNENLQEIFALQSQLNNTEISDISKTTIQNRINELEKANSDVLDKIASRTKGISKETFDAIKDVNKKQELLILQASEISKDNSLDKEVKKKIISDLESQFNNLETKRNKLASGKSTILDALSDNESARLKEKAANLLINEEKAKGKTDEEINFTEEEINKKAIEIYNQNAVQQEATITETKQEAQPQAEIKKESVEVELKNEGKADIPTKENIDERLRINHPFYEKVSDALNKLGLINKYNPETKEGDIVGGYTQPTSDGGFSVGSFVFSKDGSISFIKDGARVEFDKNGNVISENTKEVAQEKNKIEIEGTKESITNLEKTRDSEAFKYKEATETDVLGNRKKVKRLKTAQELKESTDKINAAIDKAKSRLTELEKNQPQEVSPVEDVVAPSVVEGETKKINGKELTFYKLEGDNTDSGFAVEKNKDGYVIQSALLPFSKQKQGIGTDFYVRINNESIEKTGSPLKSSENLSNSGGKPFWEKLVDKGLAEKTEDGFKFKEQTKVTNEKSPPTNNPTNGNVQSGNNIMEPSATTEQENNQASNIQPTDNSRNVEVKREIKIADKGQSYTVEKTDLGLVITDKKGKAPSKVTERKILDEYSKTINFTQGTRVDDSFESSAETYIDDVATKSQNPSEIAEAISYVQNADMNENNVDPVQVAIAEALGEKSVEKSSFTNINDRNNINQSIALQYFAPSGKGKGLDQIAMEVEYEIYGDYNANNPRISEEDIANFMVDNPRGSLEFLNRNKNATLEKLRAAFTDVTGLPAKPQFIEAAINQNTAFKNEIFNGNSLYLYSDEDLLSLQNQREEFEKSIKDGNQSENKQTTNENAEGINNQPDNKDGKQTPGIQKDSGSKNSGKSNESGSGSKSSMVGERTTSERIYRTTEASNSGGSTGAILSIEEREELEARGINPDWDKAKFNETLRENAKKNGVWLDYSYLEDKKKQHDHKKDNTTENDIYLNSDGKTLTKLNNLAFVLNGEHSTNLNAFMDRIEAHNELFPNVAYTIKGFMNNKLGNVSIVLEQPFVENASNASQSEINDFLQQNGFELSGPRDWSNGNKVWTNGVYEIYDARPANVLKTEDNILHFIDVVPHSVAYLNSKPEVTPEEKPSSLDEKIEKDKLSDVLDWLDGLKLDPNDLNVTLPYLPQSWNMFIEAVKLAVKAGKTINEAIQEAIKKLQSEGIGNVEINAIVNEFTKEAKSQKKSRLKIEEEVQERLDNNESEKDIIDSIPDRREKMIAQDYIERQKNLSIPEVRKKVAESFKKADEALQDKKTTTEKIDKAFRNFIARFFDRQFVPKFILNKAGGRLVRNYLIASKGATGYAKQMYDEAYDKIYKGLTSAEIKTLDKMIQLRRFIAIDKNRAENNMPDVVHPDFINRQDAEIELAELEKELGVEKFKDLNKRADNYFDEFRGLLTEMQKSGLISKESLDMFFEIDYQPRMFLEFLQNNETDFVPETSSNASLSADQIKKLEEGLNTSLIYDSQYLLSRSMNIRAKAIAMNNTNKKLVEFMEKQAKVVDDLRNKKDKTKKEKDTIKYFYELSKRVKINPIIGFTDTGSPKYKYALPKGFKNAYYYIDGVKHSIMMEEALHEQYFDSAKGFLNGNTKEVVAMVSGNAVVKALATGNNPTFFITNTPRDFFFIATFSEEYGMSVLVNMAKLAKDATLGIRDIKKGNGNFKNFVKYGGMMDFLKDQGKLKHTEIQKLFDKIDNKKREKIGSIFNAVTLSKMQIYSEVGFRMAVFNRSVKNQLKELGYTKIEDVKDQSQVDDIYTNAVASARGIMDFNQGGKITKDADAFIPYLNAATQGTRVMFDNFRERPFETTFRTAQTAGVFSGAVIGLSIAAFSAFGDDDDEMTPTERYLYAKKGVSKYDQTNYFIIFTGQKTESGQYSYIRIAKPQQITPFFSMTDGIMTSFIKAKIGDESSTDAIDNVMFAFEKNISPLEFSITGNITRNPALKSVLSYSMGYDFYRGEDLSYLRGKVPVPAEGFESKTVEDFYKKIGEESGMSPVRFKAAVESFITTPSTSPYVGFLYGGLDAMASDKDGKEVMSKLGKDLLKSTFNRVRKETTDFNRRLENDKALKKKIEQVEIDNLKTKSLFKKYADAYTNKEMSVAEISKELEKVAQDNPFEAKRLKKMIKDKIKNKDISPYVFEIKYAKSAESKALMLIDLFGDDLKDMSKLEPEEKKLLFQMKKMGAINKEVLFEYNRIITE